MRASQLDDDLYDADDAFLNPEPMRPIRLQYVTLSTERDLLADTMERLGLAHVWIGRQMFALNECDTNSLRLTAREMFDGEPTEEQVRRRTNSLLIQLVMDSAGTVERSALRDPSFAERYAQELRTQADMDLAANGVEIKARIAAAVSASEAA